MKNYLNYIFLKVFAISTIFIPAFFFNKPLLSSESKIDLNDIAAIESNDPNTYYILGADDKLKIYFSGIPEYSGEYTIGPDGMIYLPEIKSLKVEGLTVDELREKLLSLYSAYIFEPDLEILISKYRMIRAFITGEVSKPGLYSFKGSSSQTNLGIDTSNSTGSFFSIRPNISAYTFPTVYDAISIASGITQNADLSRINVKRINSISQGGGKIETNLNFLAVITEGDLTQNIRIFDGDIIEIKRSNTILKDQILKANSTNLSPNNLIVYITGNVLKTGSTAVPQGSGLVQALSSNGGLKVLSGKVEFVRFNDDGTTQKKLFKYDPNAPLNSYKNPILMSGDLINVKRTKIGITSDAITTLGKPLFQGIALWKLFD